MSETTKRGEVHFLRRSPSRFIRADFSKPERRVMDPTRRPVDPSCRLPDPACRLYSLAVTSPG